MAQPDIKYSASEYLAMERRSETKSEFLNGRIYAMAGASRSHNVLVSNLVTRLNSALLGKPCETYPSDMRVRVSETGLYTYPDITVVCGQPEFEDGVFDTLLNPQMLVEVLSPSTADYDRGAKFEHYRSLPSVQEILLVDQERVHIVHYQRRDDGTWILSETRDLAASISLSSLSVELAIAEIYDRVSFEEDAGPRAMVSGIS
jgi:Uma2 family endonuclease